MLNILKIRLAADTQVGGPQAHRLTSVHTLSTVILLRTLTCRSSHLSASMLYLL